MGQPLTVDLLTYAWERYTGWGHPSVAVIAAELQIPSASLRQAIRLLWRNGPEALGLTMADVVEQANAGAAMQRRGRG